MRLHPQFIAAALVAGVVGCGGDGSAPGVPRGIRILAGNQVTDTVFAVLPQALVVEVHDSTGTVVPSGTVVRFTGVLHSPSPVYEVNVEALASGTFGTLATATTDETGKASVIVRLGTAAGPARLSVSVPAFGLVDTARYTITPGAALNVTLAPLDTSVMVGRGFSVRGGVTDAFGNKRDDALVWSSSGTGLSISAAGTASATSVGRYKITATAGSRSGSMSTSVVPVARLAGWAFSSSIVVADLDGGNRHTIATVHDGGIGVRPGWTPDGSAVVFATLVGSLETLQFADTNGNVRLVFPSGIPNVTHQAEPAFTADGKWLYFAAFDSRCVSGQLYCLYRAKPDGSAPELLSTTLSGSNLHPSPSPDGSSVAVAPSANVIRVFDVATKTLSSWSVSGHDQAWSPDGSQIAFISPGGTLTLVKPDGTGARSVNPSQLYSSPSWMPDGRFLAGFKASGAFDLIDLRDGVVIPVSLLNIVALGIR